MLRHRRGPNNLSAVPHLKTGLTGYGNEFLIVGGMRNLKGPVLQCSQRDPLSGGSQTFGTVWNHLQKPSGILM
jgi:hypothetical protein